MAVSWVFGHAYSHLLAKSRQFGRQQEVHSSQTHLLVRNCNGIVINRHKSVFDAIKTDETLVFPVPFNLVFHLVFDSSSHCYRSGIGFLFSEWHDHRSYMPNEYYVHSHSGGWPIQSGKLGQLSSYQLSLQTPCAHLAFHIFPYVKGPTLLLSCHLTGAWWLELLPGGHRGVAGRLLRRALSLRPPAAGALRHTCLGWRGRRRRGAPLLLLLLLWSGTSDRSIAETRRNSSVRLIVDPLAASEIVRCDRFPQVVPLASLCKDMNNLKRKKYILMRGLVGVKLHWRGIF